MNISLVGAALNLHESETVAQWRERFAREKEEKTTKVLQQINSALQEAGISSWNAEDIVQWAKEEFQEEAENSSVSRDDSTDIVVETDFETDDLYLELEGQGKGYRSEGPRGDGYYTPDGADEYDYSADEAVVTIWTRDKKKLGEWDITALLSN